MLKQHSLLTNELWIPGSRSTATRWLNEPVDWRCYRGPDFSRINNRPLRFGCVILLQGRHFGGCTLEERGTFWSCRGRKLLKNSGILHECGSSLMHWSRTCVMVSRRHRIKPKLVLVEADRPIRAGDWLAFAKQPEELIFGCVALRLLCSWEGCYPNGCVTPFGQERCVWKWRGREDVLISHARWGGRETTAWLVR